MRDQLNGFSTDPGSGATLYLTDGKTDAFGGEVHASWLPNDRTKVTAFLAHTEADSSNIDPSAFNLIEDNIPRLRGGATASYQFGQGVEVSANLLYTQAWANINDWWRLDLRFAWRICESTELEIVGQNLTDPQHQEYFFDEQIQRGGFVLVTHTF